MAESYDNLAGSEMDVANHPDNSHVFWQHRGNVEYPTNTSVGQTVSPEMRSRSNQDDFHNALESMSKGRYNLDSVNK